MSTSKKGLLQGERNKGDDVVENHSSSPRIQTLMTRKDDDSKVSAKITQSETTVSASIGSRTSASSIGKSEQDPSSNQTQETTETHSQDTLPFKQGSESSSVGGSQPSSQDITQQQKFTDPGARKGVPPKSSSCFLPILEADESLRHLFNQPLESIPEEQSETTEPHKTAQAQRRGWLEAAEQHHESSGTELFKSQQFTDDEQAAIIARHYWFYSVFIVHNTKSINDSHFVWCSDNLAQIYKLDENKMEVPPVTCEGNSKGKTMSELLDAFCQKIDLPLPVPGDCKATMGILVTAMFQQHQGGKFRNQDLPQGIRGISKVDPEKHRHLLRKKYGDQKVPMTNFNDKVMVHIDDSMVHDRNLLNCSVFGYGPGNEFAFMIIVNGQDEEWVQTFGTHPSTPFNIVIGTGCYVFHHALTHINQPENHTETAVLARQIGQSIFEECSRRLTQGDIDAARANDTQTERQDLVPALPPPKPKKKKSKKAKKAKKEASEAAPEVEPEQVEEGITPSITVDPPSTMPSSTPLPPGPPAFTFSSTSSSLTCRYGACSIQANARHPTAVACPRCTPYSMIRYCSISHLKWDIRRHFTSGECGGGRLIHGAVDDHESSIPGSCLQTRPYIQETQGRERRWTGNIIERHRQALYRAMSTNGNTDYYVFDDIDRIAVPEAVLAVMAPARKKEELNKVRGTGRVCAEIALAWVDAEKAQFDELMDACLRLGQGAGILRGDDCVWLYEVIRHELDEQGLWDARMEERIAVQMGFEFGWRIPVDMREF